MRTFSEQLVNAVMREAVDNPHFIEQLRANPRAAIGQLNMAGAAARALQQPNDILHGLVEEILRGPGQQSARFSATLPASPHLQLPPVLAYRVGSTRKLWQLTGDVDAERRTPTLSRSATRANVRATDLGCSFECGGKLVFLFGDTHRAVGDGGTDDCVAWTNSFDPAVEPFLRWITRPSRRSSVPLDEFVPIRILSNGGGSTPLIDYADYSVPSGGFEGANGEMYIFYTQADPHRDDTGARSGKGHSTILARSVDGGETFDYVYHVSYDKFYQVCADVVDAAHWPALWPITTGKLVLLWGTSKGSVEFGSRNSQIYLACCPLDKITSAGGTWQLAPTAWRYFIGVSEGGPQWSAFESEAQPLFDQTDSDGNARIGEFSVGYIAAIKHWLMLYCFPEPRGVTCRQSSTPWGPWELVGHVSAAPLDKVKPITGLIWTPELGYGHYMHVEGSNDTLDVIGDEFGSSDRYWRGDVWGGEYGSYLIPRWSTLEKDVLTVRYTLSTWNPYQVVLMESTMQVT